MKTIFSNIDGRVRDFFFRPASAAPLAALRIGLAATLLLQAALVAPDFLSLYGRGGWLQGVLGDYLQALPLPSAQDVASWFQVLGIDESAALVLIGLAYLVGLVGMAAGWRTRWSTALAWATHLVISAGHVTSYGVDQFANVFLFYLMWSPSGALWSMDAWTGREKTDVSPDARFFLRALQLHLCLTYLTAGLDKAMGAQWWNGDAIWRSLMIPLYSHHDFSWLSQVPWLAKLLGWGTLVVEIGYSIFIWPQRTRRIWVAMTVSLHAGIALFLGLGTFSLAMSLFTATLFGLSAEPELEDGPAVERYFATRSGRDVPELTGISYASSRSLPMEREGKCRRPLQGSQAVSQI